MDSAPETPPKRTFTPEQRRALGRVYAFLIDIGEKRLKRLALEKEQAENASQAGNIAESGIAQQAGEQS
jgi:hypothetical protein